MIRPLALTAAMAFAPLLFAVPAAAQDQAGDKVNTLIVYGDDQCPESTGDEITVCARLDEGERYRIPQTLRQSEDPTNQSWASRVKSYETVGKFGPMSCTPIGAGGELGCTPQMIEAAYEEKATAAGVRFNQLIEQAREERLSTIDAEAAATQSRVEEIERQYMERLQREQGAPLPDEVDSAATPEVVATVPEDGGN